MKSPSEYLAEMEDVTSGSTDALVRSYAHHVVSELVHEARKHMMDGCGPAEAYSKALDYITTRLNGDA